MDEVLEHNFAIKRVHKASDEEYLKALDIYNMTTPNDIKTKSNEISMWLNRNGAGNFFELFIFILYMDNEITGLAMLSYIPSTRIVIYDYIALTDQYRVNAVLFAYASLIQNYMSSKGYDISYYIVEISNKNDGKSVDKESRLFKKLICLEGFGRIKAKYQTLSLGLDHYESSFNAYIYIKTNDTLEIISKETFLTIVHAIYYEYYLSWYSPILTSEKLKLFKENVDRYYNLQNAEISEEVKFEIEYVDCPILGNLHIDKSFGYLPNKHKRNFGKYPLILLLVFLGLPLLIGGYNYILNILGISISTVNSMVSGTFAAILSSITTLLIVDKKRL
jgi:hypothetical protein